MADPESPEISVQQEDLSPPLPSTASIQQEDLSPPLQEDLSPPLQEDLSPPLPFTASKQQEAFDDSAAFGRKNSAQSTASAGSKEGKGGSRTGDSPTGGSPTPGGSLAPSSPPARGAVEAEEGGVANERGEEGGLANERGEWGNHCEFFLTALGLAVGLGNVWRSLLGCM